jgi:hypothetical protein
MGYSFSTHDIYAIMDRLPYTRTSVLKLAKAGNSSLPRNTLVAPNRHGAQSAGCVFVADNFAADTMEHLHSRLAYQTPLAFKCA